MRLREKRYLVKGKILLSRAEQLEINISKFFQNVKSSKKQIGQTIFNFMQTNVEFALTEMISFIISTNTLETLNANQISCGGVRVKH